MVHRVDEPLSAEVLQALAHPWRLAILVALEAREQTPTELAEALEARVPELAPHLATLRTVRLVDEAPHGRLRATTTGWAGIAAHLRLLQDGSADTAG
jgi:DNA-binding transcriptional ArsR family regulator